MENTQTHYAMRAKQGKSANMKLLLLLLIINATSAYSAFGLELGDVYNTKTKNTVPEPNPMFKEYKVFVTETSKRIYAIVAITDKIEGGCDTQAGAFKIALAKKYKTEYEKGLGVEISKRSYVTVQCNIFGTIKINYVSYPLLKIHEQEKAAIMDTSSL